jgi:hypothetical protein
VTRENNKLFLPGYPDSVNAPTFLNVSLIARVRIIMTEALKLLGP